MATDVRELGINMGRTPSGAVAESGRALNPQQAQIQTGYTPATRNAAGQVTNPYPEGIFSRIFGAENVSYTNLQTPQQLEQVEAARFARFTSPDPVRQGFGSLFGGAEGEMTAFGPRVAQIERQTPMGAAAGFVASQAMGPFGLLVGPMARAARTTYVPAEFADESLMKDQGLSGLFRFGTEAKTGVDPLDLTDNVFDAVDFTTDDL